MIRVWAKWVVSDHLSVSIVLEGPPVVKLYMHISRPGGSPAAHSEEQKERNDSGYDDTSDQALWVRVLGLVLVGGHGASVFKLAPDR